MALDRLAAGVSEIHRRIPFLLHGVGPAVPLLAFKSIELVIGLGGGKVQHQRPDSVGVAVEEIVQVRHREVLGGSDHTIGLAHPGESGDEGSQLWRVAVPWSKDVEIRVFGERNFGKKERDTEGG